MMMWGWTYGGIWMIIFWVAIIGLIAWGVFALGRREHGPVTAEKNSPLDIVKERYARGEISKEEFDRIRKDIM